MLKEIDFKKVDCARNFMIDSCTKDEITLLKESGVLIMEEGDTLHDVQFDDSDESIIESVLENRDDTYIVHFIDEREGYFLIGKL